MIDLAQFDYEPEDYVVKEEPEEGADSVDLYIRFNKREFSYEDWWADQITVTVPVVEDMDAYVAEHKQEWIDAELYEAAASEVRKIRDRLLQESDKYMMIDRMDLGSATTFLTFLSKLKSVLSGKYAQYRQALRDVPQQEGFPFNIVWPVVPEEVED